MGKLDELRTGLEKKFEDIEKIYLDGVVEGVSPQPQTQFYIGLWKGMLPTQQPKSSSQSGPGMSGA